MDELRWIEFITNPELYIELEIGEHKIGLYILLFIAFTEMALFTGLLFTSDSFLFFAGIYSNVLINQLISVSNETTGVFILAGIVSMASIAGNLVAYHYGSRVERHLINKKDGFIYKRKYLEKSKLFFEKYGGWAIISAHYMPLVRTFIPILAAASGMKFLRFAGLVSMSSILWSFSLILSGHYLYRFLLGTYDFDVRQYLWVLILVFIVVSAIYLLLKFVLRRISSGK